MGPFVIFNRLTLFLNDAYDTGCYRVDKSIKMSTLRLRQSQSATQVTKVNLHRPSVFSNISKHEDKT